MAFPFERRLLLNPKTLAIAALSLLLLLSLLLVGSWLLGELALGLLLLAGLLLLMVLGLESYYRLYEQNDRQQEQMQRLLAQAADRREQDYQQIESLFSLMPLLKLRHPLPPMRGWAASPDFLKLVVSLLQERQPQCVVEASSGVSTLVTAYMLESIAASSGAAQLISLEHDAEYVRRNRHQVEQHKLQATAKIVHAPLQSVSIQQQDWLWYSLSELDSLTQKIDFLIIDGPPQSTQSLARYPALPLLFDRLSDDAILVLDDADRSDEQEIIRRWQQEFSDLQVQQVTTEKGACVLRICKSLTEASQQSISDCEMSSAAVSQSRGPA